MNLYSILFSFKLLRYCVFPPMFQMGKYYSFFMAVQLKVQVLLRQQ